MNQRLLKTIYLMAWVMILGFALPFPSVAQEAAPIPKITPLWTSTQKFCPPDIYCGDVWELSADDEHLFVYIVPTSTMYVFSKGIDNVATYPIPLLSKALNGSYEYLPLDDHTILYSDDLNKHALTRLDLFTGENHIFGSEIVLESCRNHHYIFEAVAAFFHYLPTLDALLVCRNPQFGLFNPPNLISTVDLKTGQLTDVARLSDGNYGYINVVGGRDGGIYLEPNPSLWRSVETRLIMRWNARVSTWDNIEFPNSNIPENDDRFFEFMGVDTQSNLYFQSDYDKDMNQKLMIVKTDPTGKTLQVIKQNQLGWNPEFIGLDANGQMIILNRMTVPSANTTVEVDVISRYEFDAPNN